MDFTTRRSTQIIIVALFSVVITQLIYVALSSTGADINRMVIWTTEAVAFLAMSLFGLNLLVQSNRNSAAWIALALAGIFNVIQVGMGLAMFSPLTDAGEAMAPAFQSVLAGAFFFYFVGKFLFGFAAILTGASLLRSGAGIAKGVGMDMVQLAGAAGTAKLASISPLKV